MHLRILSLWTIIALLVRWTFLAYGSSNRQCCKGFSKACLVSIWVRCILLYLKSVSLQSFLSFVLFLLPLSHHLYRSHLISSHPPRTGNFKVHFEKSFWPHPRWSHLCVSKSEELSRYTVVHLAKSFSMLPSRAYSLTLELEIHLARFSWRNGLHFVHIHRLLHLLSLAQ